MKYLVTLAAIGLCTSALAQSVVAGGGSATITSRDGSTVSAGTITSRDGSTISGSTITSPDGSTVSPRSITSGRGGSVSSHSSSSSSGSVILDNQSSVTSSVTTDQTGVSTSQIVGRTGSMCSATHDGQRCEISCQAPQVAQCGKAENAAAPACLCR
jgi:hypothetical protein